MIQAAGIDLAQVKPEALDMQFGLAFRRRRDLWSDRRCDRSCVKTSGERPDSCAEDLEAISFTGVRGAEGIKEATVQLGGREVHIAVVNGLQCASEVLDKMKAGEVQYDFVEVMACKRGCIAGGGQPVPIGPRTKKARMEGMYKIDKVSRSNCLMKIRS